MDNLKRILLVDDDAGILEFLSTALRNDGSLESASTAEEALDRLQRDSYDVVLTDLVMPGMGGREMVKQLAESRPGAKVLYLSGYTEDAIVSDGSIESGTAFLQKPFTLQNLSRKVREVLG